MTTNGTLLDGAMLDGLVGERPGYALGLLRRRGEASFEDIREGPSFRPRRRRT